MEAPSAAIKLVKREVTRIVTPGTTMNSSLLRSHENNFLGALMPDQSHTPRGGFAYVDVTTGEYRATELDLAAVAAALQNFNAREGLAPPATAPKFAWLTP